MRQTDWVRAAPRDERELDEPVHLVAGFVFLVPVAINCKYLACRLVDADDVRRVALALLDFHRDVALVHDAQAVLVVAGGVTPLDAVVGDACYGLLGLHAGWCQIHVAVHSVAHAVLVVQTGNILHVGLALRRVEVGRGVRQEHVVDRHEQERRPVARRVPAELQVLRAAEW